MSESNDIVIVSQDESYVWNANDWSNLITISASAIASVLLVVFKSRCVKINLCFGLLNCVREVKDESDTEEDKNKDKDKDKTKTQEPQGEPSPEPEIQRLV